MSPICAGRRPLGIAISKKRVIICIRSNEPGCRSLFVKNNWADVRPGSLLTATLSA